MDKKLRERKKEPRRLPAKKTMFGRGRLLAINYEATCTRRGENPIEEKTSGKSSKQEMREGRR